MTITEIKTAIQEHNITDELLNALVYFTFDYDPYGFIDEYGYPDDEGVKEFAVEELKYQVEHCTKDILETIDYAISENSNYFRKNY